MWPTLFSLLGLALLVTLWSAATRAREVAQAHATRTCADAGVQLLDQSVVLREIRPVRAPWGIALRRRYSFDYSLDGVGRERGFLVYLGPSLESASVPTRAPEA
jgi:hypothetical protein